MLRPKASRPSGRSRRRRSADLGRGDRGPGMGRRSFLSLFYRFSCVPYLEYEVVPRPAVLRYSMAVAFLNGINSNFKCA